MMNPKLKKTIIVLHISAILYFLAGIGSFALLIYLSKEVLVSYILSVVTAFSIIIGIFVEIVVSELKEGKLWAWVAAVILCMTYLLSIFIILGIIGLVGLLHEDVRNDFFSKDKKKGQISKGKLPTKSSK